MKFWSALSPGALIDIVAPGYAVTPEVLAKSIQCVKDFGFVPRVPDSLLRPEFFHANSDANRFLHLKKALLARDSAAVWCLRGGYGSNRLLPLLAKLKAPKTPKVLIGISDVTSLHLFLNQKWGWPTLHASLLDRIAKGNLPQAHVQEILAILSGKQSEVVHSSLRPLNNNAKKSKILRGPIRGGNLTTLQGGVGTPWAVKAKGCFLFLEDIGERGYRVDRMLEHLEQAGVFTGCLGVLFGHFTGGEEPAEPMASRVFEALQRFANLQKRLPVWTGVESGHDVNLRALPLATAAVLRNGVLTIQTGCKVVV